MKTRQPKSRERRQSPVHTRLSPASGSRTGASPSKSRAEIKGFQTKPKTAAGGRKYEGRLTLHDVRWSGEGSEAIANFTMTAEQLADAAENRLLWTDQEVQRGWKPELDPRPVRELALADGYPNPAFYIFDAKNADEITEKLLGGDKLYLDPLIWNLRPGEFTAYFDDSTSSIYLYSGKLYLPDSHHRQQAILKAVRAFSPHFSPALTPGRGSV